MMFSMLNELRLNCFWHADDDWSELREILPEESQKFYANFMIELAKNQDKIKKLTFGHGWIVEAFHEGPLSDFIDEDLLIEAVNKGFWEIANDYFVANSHNTTIPDRYDTIMEYSDKLDLSRVNEFKKELLGDTSGWIDDKYLSCFERARDKLSIEDGAWLVRPIIERHIGWTLAWDDPEEEPEKSLEKEIKPYKEYIDTSLIQNLIKDEIKTYVADMNDVDIDIAEHNLLCINILSKYWNVPEQEFKDLINANFPLDGYQIEDTVIELDFPRDWLNQEILSKVQDNIIAYFDMTLDKKTEGLIYRLHNIQRAIRNGFLDEKIAREKIASKLEVYLALKRRPGGAVVETTLGCLDSKYVDTKLYRSFVHQGISDLVMRNRIDAASKWYRMAQKEGWLDKTKVQKFKLSKA